MKDVFFAAGDYTQDLLTMMESNVKPDRTDLDYFLLSARMGTSTAHAV